MHLLKIQWCEKTTGLNEIKLAGPSWPWAELLVSGLVQSQGSYLHSSPESSLLRYCQIGLPTQPRSVLWSLVKWLCRLLGDWVLVSAETMTVIEYLELQESLPKQYDPWRTVLHGGLLRTLCTCSSGDTTFILHILKELSPGPISDPYKDILFYECLNYSYSSSRVWEFILLFTNRNWPQKLKVSCL